MGRWQRFREQKQFGKLYITYMKKYHGFQNKQKLYPTRYNDAYMNAKYGIRVVEPFRRIYDKVTRLPGSFRVVKESQGEVGRKEETFWRYDKIHGTPKPPTPIIEQKPFFPCFLYDGSSPLGEGISHALNIAKAVHRQGLPSVLTNRVEKLKLENCDEILTRLIMQSQRWDPTLEKLPKRVDPVVWWIRWPRYFGIPEVRKNSILLENLFRYTLTMADKFPSLKDIRYFKSGEVNGFTKRNNESLRIYLSPHTTICSTKPLSAVENLDSVNNTISEIIPNIYPMKATIDLKRENLLDDQNKEENVFPLMWADRQLTPQTLLISKEYNYHYPWTVKELAGNAVMAAFGAALSVAKRKYGTKHSSELPQPIVTQCIQVNGGVLDFVVFQLNTLNLNNDDGVKNVAWIDEGNKFFSTPHYWDEFNQVDEFEPNVFRKFLALMLNSAS